jgi:hypothetical protein
MMNHQQSRRDVWKLPGKNPLPFSVPQGRLEIARQFIAGKESSPSFSVPQGRLEIARQFIAGKEFPLFQSRREEKKGDSAGSAPLYFRTPD